jgi:hypothetical protein
MKRFVFGLMVLLSNVIMPQADALFEQQLWAAAYTAYAQEADPSVGVLLRMGECAVRDKQFSNALYALYRALPRMYGVGYYNLSLQIQGVMKEAGFSMGTMTPGWYVATAAAAIPPLLWQLLGLLLLIFALWQMRWWWAAGRYLLLFIMALGVLVSIGVAWWSISYRNAVGAIAKESVTLRSGPDERFTIVGNVSVAMPLQVGAHLQLPGGQWYCKVSAGVQSGWAPISALQLI